MEYTQALVAGSRIVLSHGGVSYEYHQGGADNPFLGENPDRDGTLPGAGS